MFLIECMCILSVLVIFSSVHAAGLNLVHELFSDMSASEAKHQGRLLHRVALVISIMSIKICMIFGTTRSTKSLNPKKSEDHLDMQAIKHQC